MVAHPAESPAKKQSKWSPDEDALIIDLRGSGMKWEDISKRLPGRSAISCRLHYQNYLERRSEWDEERKNKLARLYERFKPEMWSKVAEEMAVPWRAAEAMHWQLGEADMARRAGVVPFSLSSTNLESHGLPGPGQGPNHRHSPSRGHMHSNSQGSIGHGMPQGGPGNLAPMPMTRYQRSIHNPPPPPPPNRSLAAATTRRDSVPRSVQNQGELVLAGIGGAPIGRVNGQMLPSVAEMTTGISPYNTPAYSVAGGGMGYVSPGPLLPGIGPGGFRGVGIGRGMERPTGMTMDGKRRASPDAAGARESSKRRQ